MTSWTLLWRTVRFYWRANLAVAAGVAVGAAVVTGALLLGESLRGSLREMVLSRLGPVDALLRTDRFFREELGDELQPALQAHPRSGEHGLTDFVPLLLLEGTVESTESPKPKSVGAVQVIGCDDRFWHLDPQQQGSDFLAHEQGAGTEPGPAQSASQAKVESVSQAGIASAPQAKRASASQPPSEPLHEEPSVVLNDVLAERLGIRPGEHVLLRLPHWGNIAPESALGRKEDTVASWRVRVARIVDSSQWAGRFALKDFSQKPLLAYLPLQLLQRRLQQPGRVNALLAIRPSGSSEPPEAQEAILAEILRPKPEDYGVRIAWVDRERSRYIHISTDQLLFAPALEEGIRAALQGERFQAILTYLANTIQLDPPSKPPVTEQDDQGRIVPYSTVTAMDFVQEEPLGPFCTVDGRVLPPLQDGPEPEIVVNSWAAQSLGLPLAVETRSSAQKGGSPKSASEKSPSQKNPSTSPAADTRYIYLTFFEPETIEGQTVERTVRCRLAGIVAMEGPARDPHLTPEVPGLTDRRSISQWEVPFRPFHEGLIRKADDEYFRREGLTPKAFVSLATGWRLWGSRFGRVSSFRVAPSPTANVEHLSQRIQRAIDPARLGLQFQPVKRSALAAAQGSTSFEMLFLGFSAFLIISAAMLVSLLFRLAVEARQEQLGLLMALGFTGRRIQGLLVGEGAVGAGVGSLLGTLAGTAYAAIVLAGFRTWAASSLGASFLQLHGRWESFLVGFLIGILLGLGTILWSVMRAVQASPRHLLSHLPIEEATDTLRAGFAPKQRRKLRWLVGGLVVSAGGLGLLGWGWTTDEMGQAGIFFAAGALMLGAGLLWVRERFRPTGEEIPETAFTGPWALVRLAFRNAARNPRRSSLTVGLMAAAVFLITATSMFRLQLPGPIPKVHDGTGGLLFWAETTVPIFHPLSEPETRARLNTWTNAHEQMIQKASVQVFPVRVRTGDDASCRNLYRPQQPRILGLPKDLIARPAFAWAQTLAQTPEEKANPWLLLEQDVSKDADAVPMIPGVLDADMATYALKVKLGQTVDIRTNHGGLARVRIVGLLRRSIFQGDILISEKHFVSLFPQTQGYRLFLMAIPPDQLAYQADVQEAWVQTLGEYGVQVQTTQERLAGFFAVQNTYLAAFQSLGGLGLLLGTLGLGVVQVRNVLQRRRELALLQAVGFAPARLGAMILWETWMLLGLGLVCGAVAAGVAVWPHWLSGQSGLPWNILAGGLALVVGVGTLAGLCAVRAALRIPLLHVLRAE